MRIQNGRGYRRFHHAPLLGAALGLSVLFGAVACSSDTSGGTSTSSIVETGANAPGASGAVPAGSGGTVASSEDPDPAESSADAAATYDGGTPTPSETVSLPPAVTIPVPAPGGGDINQTVAAIDMTTQPSVALDQPGDFGNGVKVTLDKVDKITTTAQLPGEIAGPGVALTFSVENNTDNAVDLNAVVVDLADSTGTPAIAISAAPAAPFAGSVAAGARAAGVYVFTLSQGFADPAVISVTYSAQAPVVAFSGAVQ